MIDDQNLDPIEKMIGVMEPTVIEMEKPSYPMTLIDKALRLNATPETLQKLMELQDRWDATQARKAFIAEMSLAKAKFKPILKKKSGYNDRYKYETLTDVSDAVDAALNEHGFSYDWETEDLPDGKIRVTCVVTHEAGHSKRNSLSGRPEDTADAKANMNGHQRMGGAVTYLQRYTLKAALGVAASLDDDAHGLRGQQAINADEYTLIAQLIEETKADEPKMLAHIKANSIEEMTKQQYQLAVSMLQRKAKLQKELTNATAKP